MEISTLWTGWLLPSGWAWDERHLWSQEGDVNLLGTESISIQTDRLPSAAVPVSSSSWLGTRARWNQWLSWAAHNTLSCCYLWRVAQGLVSGHMLRFNLGSSCSGMRMILMSITFVFFLTRFTLISPKKKNHLLIILAIHRWSQLY